MVSSGLETRDQCQLSETIWNKKENKTEPEYVEIMTKIGSFGSGDKNQDIICLTISKTHIIVIS